MPQFVGQVESTSTMEKPLPSIWFWNAFLIAFFAILTFFTLFDGHALVHSATPSSVESISQMRTG